MKSQNLELLKAGVALGLLLLATACGDADQATATDAGTAMDAGISTGGAGGAGTPTSSCDHCNSVEKCQEAVDRLIVDHPTFNERNVSVAFATKPDEDLQYCDSLTPGTITCPEAWVARTRGINEKLLFHELGHQMKVATLDEHVGNGSEFQASLLEDFYFPSEATCSGGHYHFTDKNGVVRRSIDFLNVLHEDPKMSEADLWEYVMGRSDTLVPYLSRFGVDQTSDLIVDASYQ